MAARHGLGPNRFGAGAGRRRPNGLRTMLRSALRTVALGVVVAAAGCAANAPATEESLYDALGGADGVAAIVDGMLRGIAADERISAAFARGNVSRLRRLLEEQFCEVSGGPCVYSGFSMAESHRGMRVTDREFNAVVECLLDAMEAEAVPVPVQNRLVARLAPLYGAVVYR